MMRQLDEALERRADRGRSFLLGGRGTRVAATPPPKRHSPYCTCMNPYTPCELSAWAEIKLMRWSFTSS